jgi:hypothetical protein
VNYLIYINELGPNYKGDNIYEFIFSDVIDVWGENWDNKPANGYPSPPEINYIKKVGVLTSSEIKLNLIQNSDVFSVLDSIQGVICLGWESDENEDFENKDRLVFQFGKTEKEVKDKLYERDIVLEFEKKLIYEN